jgi:universal stress protein E
MAKSRTALVIIDPTSEAQPALRRAEWLAETLGVALELFVCDTYTNLPGNDFLDPQFLRKAKALLLDRHRERLERLAEPLRARKLRVSTDTAWDRPLQAGILRKIKRTRPELVLKDTHFHSALRRSIFSNTDWDLIRSCPVPLWLVKPHEDAAVSMVLAAVDPLHERDKPAQLDRKIIRTARELTDAGDGRLKVVHAFDPAPVYAAVSTGTLTFPVMEPVSDIVTSLRKRHQAALTKLASRHKVPPEDTRLVEGDVRDAIVGACENLHADVAVIGAVARRALARLALGSTAERVLDFVPCDLLIVKPDRARS